MGKLFKSMHDSLVIMVSCIERHEYEDAFWFDDFQCNLQDLLQSEWGENAEIQSLCVKDTDGKTLIEY